ncbi:TolC family protein [Saccharicrinis sp. FJH2]|uniref:TolC family protein n=1 Tax=Saccharicrinis sp. FJH65 TaxID=3344659 RepID=UPI0035F2AB55
MNKLFFILILSCFIIFPYKVQSQEKVLTLDECIAIALENSFEAFKTDNLFKSEYYVYMEYLNLFRPTLSLNITPLYYNRSLQQVYDSEVEQLVYVDLHNLSSQAGLSVNQKIKLTGGTLSASSNINRYQKFGSINDLDFITVPFNINYSQNIFAVNEFKWKSRLQPVEFEIAKHEYAEQREAIALQTINLYFAFLSAQSNLTISGNYYEKAEALYEMGKKRYEINTISLDELYQLDLRRLKAKNNLERQKNAFSSVSRELTSFLEISGNTKLICTIPDNIPIDFIPVETVVELVKINNPAILALQHESAQARYNLERAKSNRFSSTLNLGVGLNNNANTFSESYRNPTQTENARVSISIPIMDWGNVKRDIILAEDKIDETEWHIKKQKDYIINNVIDQANEFNIQKLQVMNAYKADTLAQTTYDMVEKRFINGTLNVLNLNDAQNEKENTKNEYLNALRNYWTSYYRLRQYCLFDFEQKEDILDQVENKLNDIMK